MRFTPRILRPWTADIPATTALLWTVTGHRRPNTQVNELLSSLRAMPAHNDFHWEEDRNYVTEEVNSIFEWLKHELVAAWYHKLHIHTLAREAFSLLILHLKAWGVHYQADGCFLTLSYLVSLLHFHGLWRESGLILNLVHCTSLPGVLMQSRNGWYLDHLCPENGLTLKFVPLTCPGACSGQTCLSAPSFPWLAQG